MVDFERDFPQAPATSAASSAGKPRMRVWFADAERHRTELALLHPLEIEGERVEHLIIHRLTAGEMIHIVEADDAPDSDEALIRHVTAAMTGWPIEVLEALSPDDSGRVAEAALPFLPAGLLAALARGEAAGGMENSDAA